MRLLNFDEYLALPHVEDTWLIDNLIVQRSFNILWGPAKSGKTILSLALGLAVAQGGTWLGKPAHQGTVLVLELDTPQKLLTKTLRNLQDSGVCLSTPHLLTPHPQDLPGIYPLNVCHRDHFQILSHMVMHVKPSLVIVDCLAETSDHDENEASAVKPVIQALKHLTVFHPTNPCACWLLHHTVKFEYQSEKYPVPGALKAGRGSSYLAGAADSIWFQHRILSDTDPNALLECIPRSDQPFTYGLRQQAGGWWSVAATPTLST